METQFLEEGERIVARPRGRMEASDGIDFASAVEQRLRPGTTFVTVDLDGVEFMNFGAIRAILRLARTLTARKTGLDFLNGNILVRDALDQAGLDDFFPFTPPYKSTRGNLR